MKKWREALPLTRLSKKVLNQLNTNVSQLLTSFFTRMHEEWKTSTYTNAWLPTIRIFLNLFSLISHSCSSNFRKITFITKQNMLVSTICLKWCQRNNCFLLFSSFCTRSCRTGVFVIIFILYWFWPNLCCMHWKIGWFGLSVLCQCWKIGRKEFVL